MKRPSEFINMSLVKMRQKNNSTFYNDGVLLHKGYIDDILFEEYVSLMSEGIKETYRDDDFWQSFVEGKYGVSDSFIHEDGSQAYHNRLNEAHIYDAVNENVDDVIYNKKHGILWHLTTKEKAKSILNNGLEARIEKKISTHPPRIYFFTSDSSKDIIKKYGEALHKNDDIVILRIDLNKLNRKLKFFMDKESFVPGANAVFTRWPIPPFCIKKVDNFNKNDITFVSGLKSYIKKLFT